MKFRINWLLVMLLLGMSNSMGLYAQTLSAKEKSALERRVKDKVDEFQIYLKQLGDRQSTSQQVKANAYSLALKLFIGECKDYSIYDTELKRNVFKKAVRMETSSKNHSRKGRTKMSTYLLNLRNNKTYTQIEITDADIVRVDNIYKVGDHYECMAYFCQKYIGYRDGREVYSDITTKKVKVYINAIKIPKRDGTTQTVWNALLGDIYVIETRAIDEYD